MYKSPIIITSDLGMKMAKKFDEDIYQAVLDAGINVDKDELLRALQYDRGQYEKGYADGKADALKWIPVEDEQKPKDRENYFIAYVFGDSDMHFFGEAKYHAYEGNGVVDRPHFSNEGVNEMRVTHWMEIPKLPPKGE